MTEAETPKAERIPRRAFLTLPEVAEAKGVTRTAVLYAINRGQLRGYRTPGSRVWQIPVRHARAYLGLAPLEAAA